jgi:D-lactate dehydrogenase
MRLYIAVFHDLQYTIPMPSIVFLEVDKDDEKLIKGKFPTASVINTHLSSDGLINACKDAEIVSPFIYSKFPKEVLEKLPKLRLISTRSVGYNHIDLEVCRKKGITVCNVPDYGSHVIAEHVFAMLLSKIRHIAEADDLVELGDFDYHGLRGISLRGKTIGIVGTGKIGASVARIAHGFGMSILAIDHCRKPWLEQNFDVKYVTFNELLENSDIITLHVPATDETHHMINDVALHRMKPGVILVNTARGELIDTQALVSALEGKKVRYAMLDVLEHEKNFEENKILIKYANVITTPHIAFYADESMTNMYLDCFESIEQWELGHVPDHAVGPREKEVCDIEGFRSEMS